MGKKRWLPLSFLFVLIVGCGQKGPFDELRLEDVESISVEIKDAKRGEKMEYLVERDDYKEVVEELKRAKPADVDRSWDEKPLGEVLHLTLKTKEGVYSMRVDENSGIWVKREDETVVLEGNDLHNLLSSVKKEKARVSPKASSIEDRLRAENWKVRLEAVDALCKAGGKRGINMLKEALGDRNGAVRARAVFALSEVYGIKAIPHILPLINDPNWCVRAAVAKELGRLRAYSTVDSLIAAMKDENVYVRQNSAEALGEIGDPKALDVLILALKDPNWGVRWYAAQALGRIGDPKAIENISRALDEEENSEVKKACKVAIKRIEMKRRVKGLYE